MDMDICTNGVIVIETIILLCVLEEPIMPFFQRAARSRSPSMPTIEKISIIDGGTQGKVSFVSLLIDK